MRGSQLGGWEGAEGRGSRDEEGELCWGPEQEDALRMRSASNASRTNKRQPEI